MQSLHSPTWWDQRVHGHWLAYRQKLGVAAGDHGLLDVRPVDEQLGHGPAISVSRNAANARLC